MAIQLTSGDTFDGIDVTVFRGEEPLDLALVSGAVARIKTAGGMVTRALTLGPERGRMSYRMVTADYAALPEGRYSYEIEITFTDGTQKTAPSRGKKTLVVNAKLS